MTAAAPSPAAPAAAAVAVVPPPPVPPGARAVQVDDVEPARPRGREAARHRDRVVAVHRLALEGALEQSDAAAAAEIDRGVDDHASWRTKLSSSRRPTCWLFSGWN